MDLVTRGLRLCSLVLDGCTSVHKLFRNSQSTEDSYQKEQHGYTQIPAIHSCCQVPAISYGACGKDGEVDHAWNVLHSQEIKMHVPLSKPGISFIWCQMQPILCALHKAKQ